jgi:hypothetical protein
MMVAAFVGALLTSLLTEKPTPTGFGQFVKVSQAQHIHFPKNLHYIDPTHPSHEKPGEEGYI